ncbi:MAG: hypothetical protein P4L10_02435 [Acidobacteriaceae bacterium]|nr:hypothetical protein [Acidobacteriaceae bacterium]
MNAFVETTILTDALLKPGSAKNLAAKAALKRYAKTELPVYAIREFKAGPLHYFCYFHNKLVTTKSLADTVAALNQLSPFQRYLKSTSFEALEAAIRIGGEKANPDDDLADRYRLSTAKLIVQSWRRRRKLTHSTVQDLPCYVECAPQLNKDGIFDSKPRDCDPAVECCLAKQLRLNPEALRLMRDSIPETSVRQEDRNRRAVLKRLIKHPKERLDKKSCKQLGDAYFAFFCPEDSVILTTNIKDHQPLAASIGKVVEKP